MSPPDNNGRRQRNMKVVVIDGVRYYVTKKVALEIGRLRHHLIAALRRELIEALRRLDDRRV